MNVSIPEISVYMIVYNGQRHVGEAVRSILEQGFRDFEFVIVDDGSTDATFDILTAFNDPRVRIIRQPNIGRPKARNRALLECKGRYIAVIDADDMAMPTRLQRQWEFLERNPDISILFTDYVTMNGEGGVLWTETLPPADLDLRKLLYYKNPILNSSAMFRHSVYEKIGPYDESMIYCQDYDFWVRGASMFRMACLSEPLAMKRLHDGMIMMNVNKLNLKCAIEVRKRAMRIFHLPWYFQLRFAHLVVLRWIPQTLVSSLLKIRWAMMQFLRTSRHD